MINQSNYFSLNNKGLSQSKIKDYVLCPNYFFRRNVSGELAKEHKKTFDIGSAVDDILTQHNKLNNFAICENKLTTKAGKAEKMDLEIQGKTVLTRADYNKIIEISAAVMDTSAYKEIEKTYTFQEILVIEDEDLGEHFDFRYGMADAYKINDDGVCDLLDIKTTVDIDPKKYMYKFTSYGYDLQLWYYSDLLKKKYPQIKSFRYWHLSAEKSEPYRVKLFPIPNHIIDQCGPYMEHMINKIANDKDFKREDASFKIPTPLFPEWIEANNN